MNPHRALFREFCSVITGRSEFAVEGTGLVDSYQELMEKILGAALVAEFYAKMKEVVEKPGLEAREEEAEASLSPSPIFGPIVRGLMSLWYLGLWNQLPNEWYAATGLPAPGPSDPGRTHVPSELAYVEQFSYPTAGAHPPGAKPTGFGSWSIPPVE